MFSFSFFNKGSNGRAHSRLAALFFSLAIASPAQAATYYVATSGNNSNPGTAAAPFKSIAYAVKKMAAGDTTYVKGGVYDEAGVLFSRSGTASAPIQLLSAPGESPVIRCLPSKYEGPRHIVLFQHASGYKNAIGWITIEGFEIRNCWHGINVYNGHDIVIRRNKIVESHAQGILGNGKNVLIDRNRISKNGNFAGCASGGKNSSGTSYCVLDHGVYMAGSLIKITNNIFDGNLSYGVQMNGSSSSQYDPTKHAGPEFAGARNWLIANNTFAYQNHGAGIVVWGAENRGSRIINNIFYENSLKRTGVNGIALTASSPVTGLLISNNFFYSSKGNKFLGDSYNNHREGTHYTLSSNIISSVSPRFVNAEEGDFYLQTGSPAIDKGSTLTTEVPHDFLGKKRPQSGGSYDIGAFEYSGTLISRTPNAPSEFQVR